MAKKPKYIDGREVGKRAIGTDGYAGSKEQRKNPIHGSEASQAQQTSFRAARALGTKEKRKGR